MPEVFPQMKSGHPERKRFKIAQLTGVDVSSGISEMPEDKALKIMNYMPIIGNKLKKIPGHTDVTLSVTLAANILRIYTAYVGAAVGTPPTPYIIIFCTNGQCYAHNLSSGTTTSIWAASTFTDPRLVQWKQERILVIDPSAGLKDWDGTTATNTDTTKGNYITVWEGRAFIFRNDTNAVIHTAPDTYDDFNTANGAGAFELTDPNIKGQITGIAATSDIIYVFSENATLTISNLQSSGATVTMNVAPLFGARGCNYTDAITVYENIVYTMDEKGIWEIIGFTSRRISDPDIDGYLPLLTNNQFPPVGFIGTLYNIDFFGLLVRITPPGMSTPEKWIWCFYNQGWFFVKLGHDSTFIADGFEVDGTIYNFQADLKVIKNYFDEASTNTLESTLITQGYTFGDDALDKQLMRFALDISGITASLDFDGEMICDGRSFLFDLTVSADNAIVWKNDSAATVQWQNGSAEDVNFVVSGEDIQTSKIIDGRGKTIQIKLTETSNTRYSIDSMLLEFFHRSRW